MSSVDYLRQFVGERLTAAAEEIFGVFHETIVQYEEEIGRQRKLLDVVLKPEIKLRRIELPQHNASQEHEILVEQRQLWNQERNSSVDQVDPEPPQIKEEDETGPSEESPDKFPFLTSVVSEVNSELQQLCNQVGKSSVDQVDPGPLQIKDEQEEVRGFHLGVKQENQDLILISKYENDQREDQTGPSEESPVKFPLIVSVVSAKSEMQQQQLFNKLDGAESQDQNKGKREDLEPKLNNKYCNSDTNDVSNKTMLKTDSVTGKKSLPCDTCGKVFRHRGYLRRHMKIHTGERSYTCKTCGKTFTSSSGLLIHTRRVHTGEKPYICKTCGKTLTSSSGLLIHTKRVHTGEKPYICKTCGKGFAYNFDWRRHSRRHTEEKPYVCQTCGEAFRVSSRFIAHLRVHLGEKPYVCKTCGKTFKFNTDLVVHVRRAHTGESPYVCKTCGKTFKVNGDLVVHVRRAHTGERPYVCKMCGKDFFTSSTLSVHMRRAHTDEKPYLCKTCGKGFIFSSDLVIHNRVHTGERPYVCKICGKGFAASFELVRHVRRHTDG